MRRRIHAYAAADPVFHVCIGDKNRLNHYSKLNHVAHFYVNQTTCGRLNILHTEP